MVNFWDLLKAFFPIIVILGILFFILRYVRKFYAPVKGINTSNFQIKVLATQMIMPKKYVAILKIKDKVLVVGVAENSINLLKELELEAGDIIEQGAAVEKNSFVDLLRKNLSLK
jgi:flagellar protein FliO/FliZ